jgi:outer membrane lipoprotein carrier protein
VIVGSTDRRNDGTTDRPAGRPTDRRTGRPTDVLPLLPLLPLLLVSAPLPAQDAPAALARAEQAYASARTLRAEFGQVITNPMLGDPETSSGTLYLVKPDRFAMRFAEPAGDRIVADGTWLWAYTPSSVKGQVIRRPVPTSGTATPNLFAQFVERPLERYDATYVARDTVAGDPVEVVSLVPRASDLGFRKASIAISERTGWIRRVVIIEDSGQRRTLVLTALTPNAEVPQAEVAFQVPRGVKVVGQ